MAQYGYLMHYGVQGMKWGVRNYQNADGTLTPEGRRRYDIGGNLVRNSISGVYRFNKINVDGKKLYLQNTRHLDVKRDKNGNAVYKKGGSGVKLTVKNNYDNRLKTKKDVADFYNLQRSATLSGIKRDAKQSVKSGYRTKAEAKADYKAAKRDVDRIMSKYYGKEISSFAKQSRVAGTASAVASVTFLAALPVAYIGANLLLN